MENTSKSYQDLKYKTITSLTELEEKINHVRNFTKSIKIKMQAGKLTWGELGDVNRVKVNLNDLCFLENYKNKLDMK